MKIIEKDNKKYYQCEECGHIYEKEELANKCEEWCKEYKSCNLEIVKESVSVKGKIDFKQLFFGILIGGAIIFILANFKITQTQQTSRGLSGKSSSVNENLVSQIVNQVLPSQGF
jgi:predicted ATP-dependent serine protease